MENFILLIVQNFKPPANIPPVVVGNCCNSYLANQVEMQRDLLIDHLMHTQQSKDPGEPLPFKDVTVAQ